MQEYDSCMIYSTLDKRPDGAIPVLWQPESHAPFEPFCFCDGSKDDAAELMHDFMCDAPPGAAARIEQGAAEWRAVLFDPREE